MYKFTVLIFLISFNVFASITISSFNIRNFDMNSRGNEVTDKKLVADLILETSTDILGVQEIVNKNSFIKMVETQLSDYAVVLSQCGGGGRQFLGFLYLKSKFKLLSLEENREISIFDEDYKKNQSCGSLRPALIGTFLDLKTKKTFTILNTHLKAGSGSRNYQKRWEQYKILQDVINKVKQENDIIILGDLNTTGFDRKDQDYKEFSKMLNNTQMKTISENLGCTSYWGGLNPRNQIEEPSTLDHIAYTQQMLGYKSVSSSVLAHCAQVSCQQVYESELFPYYQKVSDHCPIVATFN